MADHVSEWLVERVRKEEGQGQEARPARPRRSVQQSLLAATEIGYTSLVVTYRNTEAADVDEAIGYAVRRGARRIVLFGWSMGAAIALQLADRPRHEA